MIDIKKYYNPNRPIEPKTKRDWKRKYPEFCISELPGPAAVNSEDIKPGVVYAFEYLDDNFIMIDRTTSKKMDLYWAWGFVGTHFLLSCLLLFNMKLDYDFFVMSFFIACISYPPAIIFFIKAYYLNRERKLIFDRQRGLVQVPGSFLEPPQLIRFEELHVVIALATRFQGGIYLQLFKNKTFADKYLEGGLLFSFAFGNAYQSWSYFVWYMDRNRPLPPGTALDPYRQRDYERRKSEGFPAPLHPSYIETPEHFTDEYFLLNERNKTIKGRFNMSLNDDDAIIAKKEGGDFVVNDQGKYFNTPG